MWNLLFSVVVASSQPVVCEDAAGESYTWVRCSARDVSSWSTQSDTVTVQAAGRCIWIQSRTDHLRQPERVCPVRGTPQWCLLRKTVALCRK
jgi:hypothetical protein